MITTTKILLPGAARSKDARRCAVVILVTAATAGCFEAREAPEPLARDCAGCHGDAIGAPPPGLWLRGSQNGPTDPGVGAHRAHLAPGRSAPVPCQSCHRVPVDLDDPGHLDSSPPAEVILTGLSAAGAHVPTWNASQGRCASTYCHALDGAGEPAPRWTDAGPRACGSCHGLPPGKNRDGAAHPPSALAECRNCHPAVVDEAGRITAPARHLDGRVDLN